MTEERENIENAAQAAAKSVVAEFILGDADFISIRDLIYESSGIFIAEKRKYLVENRLATRIRALSLAGFSEYRNYLFHDPNRQKEIEHLFEAITINETSFFRNQPQLSILQDIVLPQVCNELRAKGQKKLRIWSAGCSTGEEAYTLAIIIREVLRGEIATWDVKINANDISAAVLKTAKRGEYAAYTMRNVPSDLLAKYFTEENDKFIVKPELQSLVNFQRLNLNSVNDTNTIEPSNVIFCRNVIIYFDKTIKNKLIGEFSKNLLPEGYLFIGHSETLHSMQHDLVSEMISGGMVYRKKRTS